MRIAIRNKNHVEVGFVEDDEVFRGNSGERIGYVHKDGTVFDVSDNRVAKVDLETAAVRRPSRRGRRYTKVGYVTATGSIFKGRVEVGHASCNLNNLGIKQRCQVAAAAYLLGLLDERR